MAHEIHGNDLSALINIIAQGTKHVKELTAVRRAGEWTVRWVPCE